MSVVEVDTEGEVRFVVVTVFRAMSLNVSAETVKVLVDVGWCVVSLAFECQAWDTCVT